MDISKFLGDTKIENSKPSRWSEIIKPPKVVIIFGKRGGGKTALGMYLLEEAGKDFNFLSVVVNFPRSKQELLPPSFVIKTLEEIKSCDSSVILIDEGSTLIPAGQAKLEEMIKAFSALSRQREQIIILIFHATADVGTRILRGVDTLIFKEPSLRQIQWGSKDEILRELLLEAKEKLANRGAQYCYVDSEDPEFRGVLENSLPSFWLVECKSCQQCWHSNETPLKDGDKCPSCGGELFEPISKAWAGVDNQDNNAYNLFTMGHSPSPQRRRWVTEPVEIEPKPQAFGIHAEQDAAGNIIGFTIEDPEGEIIKQRSALVARIRSEFPKVSPSALENASISYYDYSATVEL